MVEEMRILAFYKYYPVKDVEELRDEIHAFSELIGIRGRILLGVEGINGSVSGEKEKTEKFKEFLSGISGFEDIIFKEDIGKEHAFKRMKVLVKDEIVALGVSGANPEDHGEYISPKEFLQLYDESGNVKPGIKILDARNEYENKVGKFRGAITPKINTFRDFPEALNDLEDSKDEEIVIYCTGGIRCERASALMKSQGFKKVRQLHQGIIGFGKEFPDTVWEGKCFVFDKRLVVPINSEETGGISECSICSKSSDLYRDCKNDWCGNLHISCLSCQEKMSGCCSEECQEQYIEVRKQKGKELIEKAKSMQGRLVC